MKSLVHFLTLVIKTLLILSLPAYAGNSLTEKQTKNFRDVHEKLGFELAEDSVGDRHIGQVIISTNPAVATVRSKSVVANSVSDLKKLIGIRNSLYENGATRDIAIYPELIKGSDSDPVVLDRAMRAFVFGDSAKVKGGEDAINQRLFPLVVTAASSAESIVINAREPMIINGAGPVVINVGELTLEPGARIIVQTITTINVQKLVVKGDATIDASGLQGSTGEQGARGVDGSGGLDGSIGGSGHDGYHLLLRADEITGGGSILLNVSGGKGGTGGQGGKGGSMEKRGRGGNGGQGGDGGNGGIGQLFFSARDLGSMRKEIAGGSVGDGGAAGPAGDSGEGGNLGPGTPGSPGRNAGSPGSVSIEVIEDLW